VRGTQRRGITAVWPAILKKRRKTPRRGDYWRLFLEELQLAVQLVASSFLFFSAVSRSASPAVRLPPSLSSSLFSVSRLALTFRIAERRIGSLNKITRLFIGAFVRVKVGTAFLSGGRPRESLFVSVSHRAQGEGERRKGRKTEGCLG